MINDIREITRQAMIFVEKHWSYYDRDWGRVRCHFCGHSDGGEGIEHAKDCSLIELRTSWEGLKNLSWEELKTWESLQEEFND